MEAKVQCGQPQVAEVPTRGQYEEFSEELKGLTDEQIADKRYPESNSEWGRGDPTNPVNSSWKVRAANRELTARKRKSDRRLVWIGIIGAFVTGWFAIFVAMLAIPLEKSAYCAWFGWGCPGAS